MSTNSENKNGIKPVLKKLFPFMIFLNIPVWLVTLFWGFDLSMIVGLGVGTAYAILSYIYLASVINNAVTKSHRKASAMMMSCYFVRMAGLTALGYVALRGEFMNFVGLILPQFYPRIGLSILTFINKKKGQV